MKSKAALRSTHQRRRIQRKVLYAAAPMLLVCLVTAIVFQFYEGRGIESVSSKPKVEEKPRLVMELISDQELLEALAEIGEPSFLANVGGELKLVRQSTK
jgi:F0F1-type ATP synthase membrane subunit c/vacuolar-type H+-ATPase subunit K